MDKLQGNSGLPANDRDSSRLEIKFLRFSDSITEIPVYRLANDVLAYIFLLNAYSPTISSVDRAAVTVASSQVCRKWRSVALNYPLIWGCIIDYSEHSLKWIEELLRRSGSSLLDFGSRIRCIYLSDRHDSGLGVLELVFRHTARLRTFSLLAPASSWELVRSSFLQQVAPNLEFLNFCVLSNDGRVLTEPIFNNHAPSLRNLHLRRCAVDFTSPILMSLTELYVHQITTLNATPTVTGWVHLLAGMPSLRRITIIEGISEAVTQTALPNVHLDNLERLSVDGAFHESVTLISQIITPPRCGLRLKCDHTQLGLDQQKLWAIIEKKLDFWETDTPDRRFVANLDENAIAIGNLPGINMVWEASEAEEMHYKRILPPDPLLTVLLRSQNSEDTISFFLSLFRLFEPTFHTTTSLTLWIDYREENRTEVFLPLVPTFRSFVNLRTLSLANDSHTFLFPLLQHTPPPVPVLLPDLHTLFFVSGYLRRNSESVAPVAAFLQWRREKGFPIQNIDIYESRVDRDFVLSQVGDVEVEFDYSNDSDPDTDEDD